jgi:hypothetical protein
MNTSGYIYSPFCSGDYNDVDGALNTARVVVEIWWKVKMPFTLFLAYLLNAGQG